MLAMSNDAWGQLWLWGYVIAGIPVALLHMRRQAMGASAIQAGQRLNMMVIFTLAVIWPLLLFSMLLNGEFRKQKKPSPPSDELR